MLHPGLYEQVIDTNLQRELAEILQAQKDTDIVQRCYCEGYPSKAGTQRYPLDDCRRDSSV